MTTETLKIKYIKDADGNRIIPVTHEDAVFDSEGVNIRQKMAEVKTKLDTIGKIPVIEHGTADTDIELTPNVLHKWDEVTSLVLTFPTDEEGVRSEYKVVFIAGEGFSLSVPLTMRWANDEIPEFEAGKQYEMSIFDERILVSVFSSPIE